MVGGSNENVANAASIFITLINGGIMLGLIVLVLKYTTDNNKLAKINAITLSNASKNVQWRRAEQ